MNALKNLTNGIFWGIAMNPGVWIMVYVAVRVGHF